VFDRDVKVSWFGAATKDIPYLLSVISPPVRYGNQQVPPSRATGRPGLLKSRSFLLTRM